MILPMYLRNTWFTGYLPFNENKPYDRFGLRYNITKIVDERANFVESKYQTYSVRSVVKRVDEALVLHSWIHRRIYFLFCIVLGDNCSRSALQLLKYRRSNKKYAHSESSQGKTDRRPLPIDFQV